MNMKNRITLFLLVLCLLIPVTTSAQIRELERSIPEVEGGSFRSTYCFDGLSDGLA